jgi:hypothetical protein
VALYLVVELMSKPLLSFMSYLKNNNNNDDDDDDDDIVTLHHHVCGRFVMISLQQDTFMSLVSQCLHLHLYLELVQSGINLQWHMACAGYFVLPAIQTDELVSLFGFLQVCDLYLCLNYQCDLYHLSYHSFSVWSYPNNSRGVSQYQWILNMMPQVSGLVEMVI